MATATPPTPGETTATPEPSSAVSSNAVSNEVAAAPGLAAPAPAPLPVAQPADPEDSTPTEKIKTVMDRVQEFRARHEKWEMAAFFFVGFVYDVLTLSRIDDTLTMVQQFVYLGVLATLLMLEQRHPEGTEPPKVLAKVWRWREDAIHFFYGSLLSSFMLFFFKSASGFTPFLFLVAMFALLVANELPLFRKLGPVVRVSLFSLCVGMYMAYVLPVIIGRMNFWIFLLAMVLAGGVIYGLIHLLRRWGTLDQLAAIRQIAIPGYGTLAALLVLFLVRVIPPVPLAVTFSGIYHAVEKKGGAYQLSHEQVWWKFWHKGDQDFVARSGDKAYYFFSVFAPKGFHQYKVRVRWYYDHPQKGWTTYGDGTLLTIANKGIERGYRSYAFTSNPKPGDWRVVLETEDGHEINRLSLTVEEDTRTEPRQFQVFEHNPDKK
ncbi:DUF2914 domain-containing protein [Hyalangium rubrum]|uniref:DUF2914 domain-containing protein n=1 Tax=Hyalangium rubrum TaxID=3103134 RepID=A0ABU5H6H1_9BACT|nr:DUF2914 domain-containing protein [Hyalangium sp. s54d21]MDY7228856.1 DUF2914 domain-containing protein [Hyalangium sp. s54d21]